MNKNRVLRKQLLMLGNHQPLLPRGKSFSRKDTHAYKVNLKAVDVNNSRHDKHHSHLPI